MSWIKFRTSLIRDGRVTLASRKCGVSRSAIIGALVTLWSLADEQCDEHGSMFGWSAEDLDREIGIENFCKSLPPCWIDLSGEFVKLPEYQEHNGSTAKKRALNQKRALASRVRNAESAMDSSLISNNKKKKKGVPDHDPDFDEVPPLVEPKVKPPAPTPSPIAEGCKWFRISDDERGLVAAHYAKERWPLNWIQHAILEVDLWLDSAGREAVKARKNPTHFRQLYATWVIEKALKRAGIVTSSNGGSGMSHPSRKPFNPEKPKSKAEIEAARLEAQRVLQEVNLKAKEIAA